MKIIRYRDRENQTLMGWIHEDTVGRINGDLFGEYLRSEPTDQLNRVEILAPVRPGKIVCVARNYEEHAREHQVDVPEIPILFLKPPSSVIGHGEKIILPPQAKRIEHEAELGVIIGKNGKWIEAEKVFDYIFGYIIANDVTARDLQYMDGQWTRGKGFDTFCPVGPWIETEIDPSDLLITCRVNSELRQMASTKDMIFSIPKLIAFISSVMTLNPGDLVLTGTPAGVGPLEKGDNIEIEIEGIGKLVNNVEEYSYT